MDQNRTLLDENRADRFTQVKKRHFSLHPFELLLCSSLQGRAMYDWSNMACCYSCAVTVGYRQELGDSVRLDNMIIYMKSHEFKSMLWL